MNSKPGFSADPEVIQFGNPAEIRFWAEKFAVSVDALQLAVQAAGTRVADVREFLDAAKARGCGHPGTTAPTGESRQAGGDRSTSWKAGSGGLADTLDRLEGRITTLTRQIMSMERMLATMDGLNADTASAQEAIGAAYELLGLYRRRRNALEDRA